MKQIDGSVSDVMHKSVQARASECVMKNDHLDIKNWGSEKEGGNDAKIREKQVALIWHFFISYSSDGYYNFFSHEN